MISEQDFERLSAYVDNALSAAEKSALEARLQREPELKAALRDLRLQTRALRDLPRLKPPRNFTLSARQAQALRPARPSLVASLFPALRLATALSALAFVAVLAASFLTANQGSLALAPAAAPVAVTEREEAQQSVAGAVAATPGAAAPPEALAEEHALTEGSALTETPFGESLPLARTTTDAAATDAATPAAESGLAQAATETPAPFSTDQQLFLPGVASAPEQAAPAPALSPLALGAVVLGVITLILALTTWLARRR